MEEKENIVMEQPIASEQTLVQEEQCNLVQDSSSGSIINKFKNAEQLCKAYENLEREFTKKCQQIKKLEQQNLSLDNAQAPKTQQEQNQQILSQFLSKNPNANNFKEQIEQEINSLEKEQWQMSTLENAYVKVLEKNCVDKSSLVNNEEFVENIILKNEDLKNRIVSNYLLGVANSSVASLVKAGGGNVVYASPSNLKSIAEAGEIAKTILK